MQLQYNNLLHLLTPKYFLENENIFPSTSKLTIYSLSHSNIIKLQYNDLDENFIIDWLVEHGFIKFFENYWLSLSWMQEGNDKFMEDFFSFLAPTYEERIHSKNNLSCYEYLINKALVIKNTTETKVLDFGSGTGIITSSSCAAKLDNIVGFDFCSEMREISRSKGLKTLSIGDFNSLPPGQFDIIVINYVLHLGICLNSLDHLLNLLVEGGILIGNVHKDLGLNNIRNWLDSLMENNFLSQVEDSQYGAIIIVKKI